MADINNIIKQSIRETQYRARKMMPYDFKVIDGELRNEIHSQLNRQEAIECFDRILDKLNNADEVVIKARRNPTEKNWCELVNKILGYE